MKDSDRRFHAEYAERYAEWVRAARAAEQLMADVLGAHNFDVHLITARAKDPVSLLQKLRRKDYDDPALELTDRLGVRVITYYERDVDPVAEVLRRSLEIDPDRSPDKRVELDL